MHQSVYYTKKMKAFFFFEKMLPWEAARVLLNESNGVQFYRLFHNCLEHPVCNTKQQSIKKMQLSKCNAYYDAFAHFNAVGKTHLKVYFQNCKQSPVWCIYVVVDSLSQCVETTNTYRTRSNRSPLSNKSPLEKFEQKPQKK